MNNMGLKLIAVFNSLHLELYEANNIRITKRLEDPQLPFAKHSRHKKESLYKKMSCPGSEFEPHTSPENIEHSESAKLIADYLERMLAGQDRYKKLIAIGEPKILGYFRKSIGHRTKAMIAKSIAKNLIHHDIKDVQRTVYGGSGSGAVHLIEYINGKSKV